MKKLGQSKLFSALKRLIYWRNLGIFLILIALIAITQIINPNFLSGINISNMLRKLAMVSLMSIGMTCVIIGGGFDLSVGAIATLGAMIAGMCMAAGAPLWVAIALPILVGLVFGAINGLIVTKVNLPPFIATLGTMYIGKGCINVLSSGKQIAPLDGRFEAFFGSATVFGLPVVVYVFLLIAIIAHLVLQHTTYGRSLFAVGGNAKVAKTSGINVNAVRIASYVIAAVGSVLAGLFVAGRLNAAHPNSTAGWEMTAAAAAIIGGTSITGGVGSVFGTIIGGAIMVVLEIAMVMLKVSVDWQNIVVGIIIIVAVTFDQIKRRKG